MLSIIQTAILLISTAFLAIYSVKSLKLVRDVGRWKMFIIVGLLSELHAVGYILWSPNEPQWLLLSASTLALLVLTVERIRMKT